mgnify:CR=1 FL=1
MTSWPDWVAREHRPPPVFCKYCGSRLLPKTGFKPLRFDEYPGKPIPSEKVCRNPQCSWNVVKFAASSNGSAHG